MIRAAALVLPAELYTELTNTWVFWLSVTGQEN